MHPTKLSKLWLEYIEKPIEQTVHPADHMFNTAVNGWTDYHAVGVSAMQIICTALQSGPSYDVSRILDFGCGHGRVARHLRAFFPNAKLYFADIDETGAQFCAEQFLGTPIKSHEDFATLELPKDMDLIWLGSVFTHLDYGRMNALFDLMANSLRPRGTLVATFRGNFLYRKMKAETDPNQARKWRSLLDQYEAGGVGYLPYNSENPLWGLSLSSIESLIGMGRRHPNLRLVLYSQVGWAAVHDVVAWAKSPV